MLSYQQKEQGWAYETAELRRALEAEADSKLKAEMIHLRDELTRKESLLKHEVDFLKARELDLQSGNRVLEESISRKELMHEKEIAVLRWTHNEELQVERASRMQEATAKLESLEAVVEEYKQKDIRAHMSADTADRQLLGSEKKVMNLTAEVSRLSRELHSKKSSLAAQIKVRNTEALADMEAKGKLLRYFLLRTFNICE